MYGEAQFDPFAYVSLTLVHFVSRLRQVSFYIHHPTNREDGEATRNSCKYLFIYL